MVPEGYGLKPEAMGEVKAGYWRCAFGLQKVDGLEPSRYARNIAERNVRGEITLDEAGSLIHDHYTGGGDVRHEEADKVSQRIVKLLERGWFLLDPYMLKYINRPLQSVGHSSISQSSELGFML